MYTTYYYKKNKKLSGRHPIKVNFIDDDGKAIMSSIHGEFQTSAEQPNVSMIFNLSGMSFPKPGTYSLDLVVDNQVLATCTLLVSPV